MLAIPQLPYTKAATGSVKKGSKGRYFNYSTYTNYD